MMRLLLAGLGASSLLVTAGAPTAPPPTVVPAEQGAPGALQLAHQPLPPVGNPSTETVENGQFPASGSPVHLTDVRAAGHENFDRFVLEFEGNTVPTYQVGYVEPPITEDPSGRQVDVAGSAKVFTPKGTCSSSPMVQVSIDSKSPVWTASVIPWAPGAVICSGPG